jgi:hypothetical protein
MRLGLPIKGLAATDTYTPRTPLVCTKHTDNHNGHLEPYGEHALNCTHTGINNKRHHHTTYIIERLAEAAGIVTYKERAGAHLIYKDPELLQQQRRRAGSNKDDLILDIILAHWPQLTKTTSTPPGSDTPYMYAGLDISYCHSITTTSLQQYKQDIESLRSGYTYIYTSTRRRQTPQVQDCL